MWLIGELSFLDEQLGFSLLADAPADIFGRGGVIKIIRDISIEDTRGQLTSLSWDYQAQWYHHHLKPMLMRSFFEFRRSGKIWWNSLKWAKRYKGWTLKTIGPRLKKHTWRMDKRQKGSMSTSGWVPLWNGLHLYPSDKPLHPPHPSSVFHCNYFSYFSFYITTWGHNTPQETRRACKMQLFLTSTSRKLCQHSAIRDSQRDNKKREL